MEEYKHKKMEEKTIDFAYKEYCDLCKKHKDIPVEKDNFTIFMWRNLLAKYRRE